MAVVAAFAHMKGRSGFLMNMLVVAIALALPFAGLTLLENLRPMADKLAVEPEISLFLANDLPREQALGLKPLIISTTQAMRRTAKLEFVPRENALAMLNERAGVGDAVTALGTNPLPDAYVLKLGAPLDAGEAMQVEQLAAQLKALPGVELVQIDSAWVKRLAALMRILRLTLLLLAVALGSVVVAVVFNTIRLQVLSQKEEIEVSRLLGATDTYVARPFYYSGALLGLFAGAIALGAVVLALQPLNLAIAEFARLYASDFRLSPPGAALSALLLALSAALGMLGALLSVRRHLSAL
jgi:cell division transport system permease protein